MRLTLKEYLNLGSINEVNILVMVCVITGWIGVALIQHVNIWSLIVIVIIVYYSLICLLNFYYGVRYAKQMQQDYGDEVYETVKSWMSGAAKQTSLADYLKMRHGKSPDEFYL